MDSLNQLENVQTMVAEDAVDWPELPHHMVELIMNKLMTPEISDYIRCGTVCTSWRTVFNYHHHHPSPRPRPVTLPPFLIVPTPSSSSSKKKNNKKKTARNNTKSLSFYNIIHKKVYNEFKVTIPSNRHFCGSSHGWLVAVDQDNDCQIRLFNPFLSPSVPNSSSSSIINTNKGELILPSLKDVSILINKTIDDSEDDLKICIHRSPSSYAYLTKAILSADPLSNPTDYIVMAILGSPGRLAYCRPGGSGCNDKVWTLVEFEYNKDWGFRDVIYYEGRFYALYYPGTIVVLDPTRNMMAVTLQIPRPRSQFLFGDAMYLVEYAGSLLQVYRLLEIGAMDSITKRKPYSTTTFRVFKLVDKTNKMNCDIAKVCHAHCQEQKEEAAEYGGWQWMSLKNMCGRTLFLGDNHSMWIRASDYPGCKPNSIYFTDDYRHQYHCTPWNGPHDLGVFNLVDRTIENHYPTDHNTPIWPVPIWIQPIVQSKRL